MDFIQRTIDVLAHPCPICLGSLYDCSPEKVVFLTRRDDYEPH
jgi:guanine deaminase